MDSKKTVGDVLSEIRSLERNYKDLTELINALNKQRDKLDLPFDPTMVLMDIRTRLEKTKNTLEIHLNHTKVESDLFEIVR